MPRKEFTYEEAVTLRNLYLELEEQFPRIIHEQKGKRSMVSMAKDLRFNRTHMYNFLERWRLQNGSD